MNTLDNNALAKVLYMLNNNTARTRNGNYKFTNRRSLASTTSHTRNLYRGITNSNNKLNKSSTLKKSVDERKEKNQRLNIARRVAADSWRHWLDHHMKTAMRQWLNRELQSGAISTRSLHSARASATASAKNILANRNKNTKTILSNFVPGVHEYERSKLHHFPEVFEDVREYLRKKIHENLSKAPGNSIKFKISAKNAFNTNSRYNNKKSTIILRKWRGNQ